MKQYNKIQLQVLKKLQFAEFLRYSDLKPNSTIENNKLQFHIDQLINNGLVIKTEDGYTLTPEGKDYASRMNADDASDPNIKLGKQAKISVVECCYRENADGKREFLVYTQKHQPFYGFQGFPAGKVNLGEQVVEAAQRELKEEAGLSGNAEIVHIVHERIMSKSDGSLLQDVMLFVTRVVNPVGQICSNGEGDFEWVTEKNLTEYIKQPFRSIDHIKKIVDKCLHFEGQVEFEEVTEMTDQF